MKYKNPMKKIAIVFAIVGAIAIAAYIFLRQSISTPGFTPAQAKETDTETKPSETVLDTRPQLIKKLQQLIKQGSNGLYNLSIREVNPDILNSTVGISKVLLSPDTVALKQLASERKLPDNVFKIKTDSIWIDGLGIKDILSKEAVDVKTIHILHPTIEVYTQKKSYNKKEVPKTLYQRLMNGMKHIGIGRVVIDNGTLIAHDVEKNKTTRYNDIAINLSNIVIDSTTQYDKNRFLFAKEAELSMKNYRVPASNNRYDFKIGSVSINATKHLLMAKNLALLPRYNKEEWQQHIPSMKDRYVVNIPSVQFRNIDWWSFINKNMLQAERAEIDKINFDIYLDRRLPSGPKGIQNFPSQLLMQLPLKLHISKLNVNELNFSYEEFSPQSGKPGTLYIDNMRGTISNLTNMPAFIKKNKFTTVYATGTFMHAAPAALSMRFDMLQYKTGVFSADLKSLKGFDGTIVNSVAEPLGLFYIKRGQLKQLTSHLHGDNYKAAGEVLFLYNNLHVTLLKKDTAKSNGFKKKTVTSFLANALILKDQNPKDGHTRNSSLSTNRKPGTSFFNLLWKATFIGILQTIGAPVPLAGQ